MESISKKLLELFAGLGIVPAATQLEIACDEVRRKAKGIGVTQEDAEEVINTVLKKVHEIYMVAREIPDAEAMTQEDFNRLMKERLGKNEE